MVLPPGYTWFMRNLPLLEGWNVCFYKTKSGTLWRDISNSKIIRKEYLSLRPNSKHLLNKRTAVSSDDLQKKHNGG